MSETSDTFVLEFERPVRVLENQIKELREETSHRPDIDISKEIKALERKVNSLIKEIYAKLTPWERVQLSRHPNRPHTIDYIDHLFEDFHEVSGDRRFADDKAIITGFAKLDGKKVCVVGIEKGRKTKEKVKHNFGMPRPEGYRKALRVIQMAGRFNIPVITLIDTPGAYPGIGAEERGQSQAIAENLAELFDVPTPILACVIGEGGSGGALGIGIADKVLMMEYAIYSVISPESCASILWADPKKAEMAANALKLDPNKAMELGVVDGVIAEPAGGAHKNWEATFLEMRKVLLKQLTSMEKAKVDKLLNKRFEKFRAMGNQTIEGFEG